MKQTFTPDMEQEQYYAFYRNDFSLLNGTLLHYSPPGFLGDVHPYYKDGTLYLFHLKTDGNYSSALAVSRNFLRYEEMKLEHDKPFPLSPYFVLNVAEDGVWYRSFYGAGRIMASSRSRDLIHWESGMETKNSFNLYQAENTYPCSGRDPFLFWDPDIGRWRITSTAYYTNETNGQGTGMDCAIALSTSANESPSSFESRQKELLRFPDGFSGEPEVTQMMKMGNRWYLFACMARRTEHHVGPVSYWIGDEGKSIDEVEWQSKKERRLTGQDLCAAQVFEAEGKTFLLGWIPQQSRGNAWGGTLNLMREVYVRDSDGILATRLDPYLQTLLSSGKAGTPEDAGDCWVQAQFSPAKSKIGLIFSEGEQAAEICLSQGELSITAPDGYVYARIDCNVPAQQTTMVLSALLEDDILEVFVDQHTALCARLDAPIPNAVLTPLGDERWEKVQVHHLPKCKVQIEKASRR